MLSLKRYCQSKEVKGQILLKLEFLQPGLSKKDRIAKQILLDALEDGRLRPNQHVVELTSGNTGTGLAIACAALELKFTAVMSAGNSMERARMMQALGAEVVLVPQAPESQKGFVSGRDLELVQSETNRIVRERSAFRADQFCLSGNEKAHFSGTGREIIQDAPKVNAFCDFVGTGGTFSGIARALKEHNADIKCYVVKPDSRQHRIQGGGYFTAPDGSALSFISLAEHRGHVDGTIVVNDKDAIQCARDVARLEGVFGGFSTGANVFAALQVLQRANNDDFSVVCMACDSGLKYLSTDLYE